MYKFETVVTTLTLAGLISRVSRASLGGGGVSNCKPTKATYNDKSKN